MNGKTAKLFRKIAKLSDPDKQDTMLKIIKDAYTAYPNKDEFVKKIKENYKIT